jgi:small subunit ribosomal protein S6
VREYELIYVIQPDATPEREQEIHSRADEFIEGSGSARVLLRDDWGKRKLAYEIRKFQKGHYFQLNFLGEGSEINELERGLRLDPDVLRFLSVQVDDSVKDVEARISEAAEQAAELARRQEERARLEAEREQERARMEAERQAGLEKEDGGAAPELAVSEDERPEVSEGKELAVGEDKGLEVGEDEKPAVSEDEKLEVSQGEKLAVAEDKKLEVDEDEK